MLIDSVNMVITSRRMYSSTCVFDLDKYLFYYLYDLEDLNWRQRNRCMIRKLRVWAFRVYGNKRL